MIGWGVVTTGKGHVPLPLIGEKELRKTRKRENLQHCSQFQFSFELKQVVHIFITLGWQMN